MRTLGDQGAEAAASPQWGRAAGAAWVFASLVARVRSSWALTSAPTSSERLVR